MTPLPKSWPKAVADLRIGDGLEAGVQLGPLIHDDAVSKVETHVDDVLSKGGTVLTGGARHNMGS